MLDMLNEAFEYETDIIYLDEGDDAVEMSTKLQVKRKT